MNCVTLHLVGYILEYTYMHGPVNVKSPNNTSKWQMRFNSAFKGLILSYRLAFRLASGNLCYIPWPSNLSQPNYPTVIWWRIKIVTLRNKTAALWDMTLWSSVDRYWLFSGQTSRLSFGLKNAYSEHEGRAFHRSGGTYVPNYKAPWATTPWPRHSLP
jgi:hypothetical protein